MHYQLPGESKNLMEEYEVLYNFIPFQDLPKYYRFSASVALFGDLLKKSAYTQKASWEELELIATSSYDQHDVSQSELLVLIEKAKKIYHKQKKIKKSAKEG
jgi:hypothetical protein